MAVRYISAIFLAAIVTFGLFYLMQWLVVTEEVRLSDSQSVNFVDVVRVEQEQQAKREETKVERPDQPDTPPPEMDMPQASASGGGASLSFGDLSMNTSLSSTGPSLGAQSDGDYLPLVRIQPQYPRRARERGIEGYVIVELTVTPDGTTENIKVVEADPKGYFERAARRAAQKFKYKPKVVNGEPVTVDGVRYIFTFEMEDS